MTAHKFVGDLLIRAGLIDAAGLALGLEAQSQQMRSLGRALASLKPVEPRRLAARVKALRARSRPTATPA